MPYITLPSGLCRYQATEIELRSIQSVFELVEANVHLHFQGTPSFTGRYAAFGEGLYFLLLNLEGAKFKLYLGRTNALARRMREYTSAFQPHSPNDFKLQAFQYYLSETFPTATLDLLFQRLPDTSLKEAEATAIKLYSPLLNEPSQPTREARQALQDAFARYVRSTFEQRLR